MNKKKFLEPCEKAFSIYTNSPYGDMWRKMSCYQLAFTASYKAFRATLLNPEDPKIEDDILDSINFLIFAWLQLRK